MEVLKVSIATRPILINTRCGQAGVGLLDSAELAPTPNIRLDASGSARDQDYLAQPCAHSLTRSCLAFMTDSPVLPTANVMHPEQRSSANAWRLQNFEQRSPTKLKLPTADVQQRKQSDAVQRSKSGEDQGKRFLTTHFSTRCYMHLYVAESGN